jgi:hypothetical protein
LAFYCKLDSVGHSISGACKTQPSIFVTGFALGFGVILFMAGQADGHRYHAGGFGHGGHLADLAVAAFAFDSGAEVRAVRPSDARENFVNANPGHGLIGFGIFGEFLDGGFVFGDGDMALHASRGVRVSHEFAGLGIDVAVFTGQAESQMLFMAVGNGLFGRGMRAGIIWDGGLDGLPRWRGLLGAAAHAKEKQSGSHDYRAGDDYRKHSASLHVSALLAD